MQYTLLRMKTSSIAYFSLNDTEGRTTSSKHFSQVVNKFMRLLMSGEMTTAFVLRLKDNIRALEPPGLSFIVETKKSMGRTTLMQKESLNGIRPIATLKSIQYYHIMASAKPLYMIMFFIVLMLSSSGLLLCCIVLFCW